MTMDQVVVDVVALVVAFDDIDKFRVIELVVVVMFFVMIVHCKMMMKANCELLIELSDLLVVVKL